MLNNKLYRFMSAVMVCVGIMVTVGVAQAKSHRNCNLLPKKSSAGWGTIGTGYSGDVDPFLDGGIGKSGKHGTFDDEWGGVILVATKVVEHGGYFCPYQLQCDNASSRRGSCATYYHPKGWSEKSCTWLCKSGYAGENCAEAVAGVCWYDEWGLKADRLASISMKTSGGTTGMINNREIHGLRSWITSNWGEYNECNVLLVARSVGEHGVIARPMTFCCGRNNWSKNDSYIAMAASSTGGEEKLLCQSGYAPNVANTDCEKIPECLSAGMQFCNNFPSTRYDAKQHTLKKDGNCYKYFCPDGKAFTSLSDSTCADCAEGVKGGSNTTNGLCVKCQVGEFFDQDSNSCKPAGTYTKTDMMYGRGKTKNDNIELERQCWTITGPTAYKVCVTSGADKTKVAQALQAED